MQSPFNGAVRSNDPFEVCFIAETLVLPGHLGHLIFGGELWEILSPDASSSVNNVEDPLTKYFGTSGVPQQGEMQQRLSQ